MTAVRLKNSIGVAELQSFLEGLNIRTQLIVPNQFTIELIGDGRNPVGRSICFVEDVTLAKKDSNVLYIVPENFSDQPQIVTEDPRYVFIKFLEYIQKINNYHSLPNEFIDKKNHNTAYIHQNVIIEKEVYIGEGAWVGAGVVLKRGTVVGKNTVIRENSVVGCPGISLYKARNGEVLRFPHLSGVTIGANVEIGANTVIVQGTLKPTIIEDDVVIGNLCNIGHGVTVKSKVWMSVGTLIGGNCVIENNSTLGLGVSVKDNLEVSQNSSIGMGSVVTKPTEENSSYFGNPAKPLRGLRTGPKR